MNVHYGIVKWNKEREERNKERERGIRLLPNSWLAAGVKSTCKKSFFYRSLLLELCISSSVYIMHSLLNVLPFCLFSNFSFSLFITFMYSTLGFYRCWIILFYFHFHPPVFALIRNSYSANQISRETIFFSLLKRVVGSRSQFSK